MKKKYVLITFLLTTIGIYAQDFIEHPIDDLNNGFRGIRLHDLDDDGNIDLIGAINGESQLMAWFGSGNGDFEAPIIIENQNGISARDIEFLDVNNDGRMDIVAIPSLNVNGLNVERLAYYINNGDRTFENFTLVDPNPNSSSSINNFFSIFDVNNDNFEDIVIRGFSTSGIPDVIYYQNTGNGSFFSPIVLIDSSASDVYAQDVNNDDLIDIILCIGLPQLYLNNGDATFTLSTAFDDYPSTQAAVSVNSGQLDNNQTEDIIIANTNFTDTSGVLWYSNDGNANFTIQENINNPDFTGVAYTTTKIVDFNNDGYNDLVSGIFFNPNNPTTGIPIWINDGNSNFTPSSILTTSDNINRSLEVFDFNNDNKMDFIVGTEDGQLTWFENNLTLSIDDETLDNLKITPNPSHGIFTLTSNQSNQQFKTTIYNVLGQQIAIIENSTTINLSKQPSGIYIAKIEEQSGTRISSKKLIKL